METHPSKKNVGPVEIKVEVGNCSLPGKAEEIAAAFKWELSRLHDEGIEPWSVTHVGCRGLCFKSPMVEVNMPRLGKTLYQRVQPMDVSRIVMEHIIKGKVVEKLKGNHDDQPFFSKQKRRVLRNCGEMEPGNVESYCKTGGYSGLEKALKKMKPDEVLKEINDAKLRDRDALALSTGEKLKAYKEKGRKPKYLICSGEGEAAEACISIVLMEGDPLAFIEGLTIAAYGVPGVVKGYIFYRKDVHPVVINRMERAIHNAREKGYLGNNIMGTSFGFDIELKANGGEFRPRGNAVCCKECARLLLDPEASVPSEDKPLYLDDFQGGWHLDNVFNAETFANIPLIVNHGASWFKEVGTPESTGTKIFSLVGDVKQAGLIEVPYGTTLSQILAMSNNDKQSIQAFMLGGLGSGFLPKTLLDTPLAHGALKATENRVGSGKILIIDNSHRILDITRYAVKRMVEESCETCQPCATLLKSILNLLNKFSEGSATIDDPSLLKEVAENLRANALCEFGRGASNVVLSGLKYFEEEYKSGIMKL